MPCSSSLRPGGQHNSASGRGKIAAFAGSFALPPIPPQLWTEVGETRPSRTAASSAAVDKTVDDARLYWPPRPARRGDFSGKDESFPAREAHLSAKRPPPQAQ